jgi:hypothetical protein
VNWLRNSAATICELSTGLVGSKDIGNYLLITSADNLLMDDS